MSYISGNEPKIPGDVVSSGTFRGWAEPDHAGTGLLYNDGPWIGLTHPVNEHRLRMVRLLWTLNLYIWKYDTISFSRSNKPIQAHATLTRPYITTKVYKCTERKYRSIFRTAGVKEGRGTRVCHLIALRMGLKFWMGLNWSYPKAKSRGTFGGLHIYHIYHIFMKHAFMDMCWLKHELIFLCVSYFIAWYVVFIFNYHVVNVNQPYSCKGGI